jgi:hypothetical protein
LIDEIDSNATRRSYVPTVSKNSYLAMKYISNRIPSKYLDVNDTSMEERRGLRKGKKEFEYLMHGCWNNAIKCSNFDSKSHEYREFCLTDGTYEDAVIEVSKYFSEFLFCDLGNITVGIPTNKQGTDQLKIISFLTAKGMLINE